MIELSTGYLDFGQLDDEVIAIIDDLRSFDVLTTFVTFGFACRIDALAQWEEIPVPTDRLARFIDDSEADGTFELGESDLILRAGGLEFRLCHERDVHCIGPDGPMLRAVRDRWRWDHEHGWERIGDGRWRRLVRRHGGA
jgi:hypothetical protein